MGCSTSKLDDEEAVQLCRDRKRFIKQAVEQRARFASGHLAYIQSMKRVSAALCDYVEGDDPREFLLDSFITPPVKKTDPGFITFSSKSFSPTPQSQPKSTFRVNYLRSGGNPAVSVEERPQSPETACIHTYSPVHHYGFDGFFAMQSSPMNSSSFFSYSPNDRPNIPPPSPQSSQWDFFWNPFSSLDYYGYPNRNSYDQMMMDDETRGLRQVREEEGIPDLEEDETEQEEESYVRANVKEGSVKTGLNCNREEVTVEDVDDEEEEDDDDDEDEEETECECEHETEHEVKGLQSHGSASIGGVSQSQSAKQVEVRNKGASVSEGGSKDESPGFTVYVNRRPTSMAEVIKDLETQFKVVCNSANEVSTLLKANRAQLSSASNEITGMKLLNPVALFRSASSRSSSSRFLIKPSSSKDDEGYESSSDFSEKSCMFSGSHQSTLDRLYAWEKKLYDEVRAGEKVRVAYEKKCKQLRNQDVKGEDPLVMDKTRAAIRDLHTQVKVSIHSVKAISIRIETLRDEELHPQLVELVQGLSRMWKVMAECHQTQKRTLDEAKLLLAGTPSKLGSRKHYSVTFTDPQKLAGSASNLEMELRNWRACFEAWISCQRSYAQALAGWLLRCVGSETDTAKQPSSGALPIFGICIQWARSLGAIQEKPVVDGLDFFAAGMGSLYGQQVKEDFRQATPYGSRRYGCKDMEMVEVGHVDVEDVMTREKMAEVGVRVLCAGMSVAMSSLTEFAVCSAEGYAQLVKQWEKAKWQHASPTATGT